MDSNILIPGIVSAVVAVALAVLAATKIELIKSLVNRISGSKYSMIYIVLSILLLTVVSFFLTKYFVPVEENATEAPQEKTKFAQNVDATIESFDYGKEIFDGVIENRNTKDSTYEANRDQQWVYQIGDIVSDENLLFDTYLLLHNIEGIHVFQASKNKFFLFKDYHRDEKTSKDSLSSFKQKFDHSSLKCQVIDLMSICDQKEKIILVDKLKIKQGKEKLFLPCYECGK